MKSVSKNLLIRAITKPKIDTVHKKKSTSNRPRAKKGELEMDHSDLFKNIYLKEKEAMFAHVKVTLQEESKRQFFSLLTSIPFKG